MAPRHSPPDRPGAAAGNEREPRSPARQALLVGRKLRKLRKDRRLDHAALGAMIGLQAADVAGIEKGEYRISLDVLCRLLAVFGADVSDFVEDAPGVTPPRRIPFPVRDR